MLRRIPRIASTSSTRAVFPGVAGDYRYTARISRRQYRDYLLRVLAGLWAEWSTPRPGIAEAVGADPVVETSFAKCAGDIGDDSRLANRDAYIAIVPEYAKTYKA